MRLKIITLGIIVLFLCIPVSLAQNLDGGNDTYSVNDSNDTGGLMSHFRPIEGYSGQGNELHTSLMHEISDVRITGSDGVRSYARSIDNITVQLKVNIDNDCNVSPSQLKLGTKEFDSCTNYSNCTFECSVLNDQEMYLPQVQTITVGVFDDNGVELSFSKPTMQFYIDNLGPGLSSLLMSGPLNSTSSGAKLTGRLTDYSFVSSSNGLCSGLKSYDLMKSGSVVLSEVLNTLPGQCVKDLNNEYDLGELSLSEGINEYCIVAYDRFDQNGSRCFNVTYDTSGPDLSLVDVKYTYANGSNISYFMPDEMIKLHLEIKAEDTSAISSVIVNSTEFNSSNPSVTASQCGSNYCADILFYSNESTISKWIEIYSEDALGNNKTTAFDMAHSFNADTTAPSVVAITYLNANGEELNNITIPGNYSATLYVAIKENESGLDTGSVKADVTSLVLGSTSKGGFWQIISGGSNQTYIMENPDCNYIESTWVCAFANVPINLNQSGVAYVTINASDYGGNTVSKKMGYNFNVDATPPKLSSMFSKNPLEYYLGASNNTIVANIIESGIGLSNKTIYLDLSNVGGSSRADPINCTQSGSGWTCWWDGIVVSAASGSNVTVSLHPDSMDDLGNKLSDDDDNTASFMVDTVAPVIKEAEMNSSSGYCPTYNDRMLFFANATDTGGSGNVRIKTNASLFSDYNGTYFSNHCTQNGTTIWDCYLEINALKTSAVSGNLDILIEDGAGNSANQSFAAEVCSLVTGSVPNCVTVGSTTPMPSKLDRAAMSQIAIPLFVTLGLRVCEGGEIYTKDISCGGSGNATAGTTELLDEESNTPILRTQASGDASGSDEFKMNCTLTMKMRVDNKVYEEPEAERFTVTVPYFNNPLGEVGQAAQQKIDDLESKIKNIDSDIKEEEDSISTWLTICKIAEVLGQLDAVIQAVFSVLYGIACVLEKFGVTKPISILVWESACEMAGTFHGFVKNYVWNPNFVPTSWTGVLGWIIKLACTILSCRLCTYSFWQNFMLSGLGAAASGIAGAMESKSDDKTTKYYSQDQVPSDHPSQPPGDVGMVGGEYVYKDESSSISHPYTNKPKSLSNSGMKSYVYFEAGNMHFDASNREQVFAGGSYWTKDGNTWTRQSSLKTGLVMASNAWSSTGNPTVQTQEGSTSADRGMLMDPWRSIHYASGCYCWPAEIYNMKKEKQVYCIQKSCIEGHAKQGLPTAFCDTEAKVNMCLYVEGAEYLKYGNDNMWGQLFSNIIDIILSDMVALVMAVLGTTCSILYDTKAITSSNCVSANGDVCTQGGWNVFCAITSAAQGLMTIMDVFENGLINLDSYNTGIEGTDYCK